MDQITGKKPAQTQPEVPSKEEFDEQVESERLSVKTVLEQVLEHADDFEDALIMLRGKDGMIGFVTNLDDFEASVTFIERVKLMALIQDTKHNTYNPGTGDSNPEGAS